MVIPISIAGACTMGVAYCVSPKRRAKVYRLAARMVGAVGRWLSRKADVEAAKASRSFGVAPVVALVGVVAGPSRSEVMQSWLLLYS